MTKHIGITQSLAVVFASLCLAQPASAAPGQNVWSVGAEGFYDDYKESQGNVDDHTNYGSFTAGYTRDFGNYFFSANGRVSYGTDNYSSDTGSSSGAPQWETEGRLRGGVTLHMNGGDTLSPYAGVGVRWFTDEGKDIVTTTGFTGYDRRITQYYIPIGATYTHSLRNSLGEGWTISPNLEVDPVPYGSVSSRLGSLGPPFENVVNNQHSGFGVRSEVMLGEYTGAGFTWQAGPFVRYWYFPDSDASACGAPFLPAGDCGIEPKNTRIQAGLAVRVLW